MAVPSFQTRVMNTYCFEIYHSVVWVLYFSEAVILDQVSSFLYVTNRSCLTFGIFVLNTRASACDCCLSDFAYLVMCPNFGRLMLVIIDDETYPVFILTTTPYQHFKNLDNPISTLLHLNACLPHNFHLPLKNILDFPTLHCNPLRCFDFESSHLGLIVYIARSWTHHFHTFQILIPDTTIRCSATTTTITRTWNHNLSLNHLAWDWKVGKLIILIIFHRSHPMADLSPSHIQNRFHWRPGLIDVS